MQNQNPPSLYTAYPIDFSKIRSFTLFMCFSIRVSLNFVVIFINIYERFLFPRIIPSFTSSNSQASPAVLLSLFRIQ